VNVTNCLWSISFIDCPLYSHQKCGGYSLMCWRKHQRLSLVEFMHECTIIFLVLLFYFLSINKDFYVLLSSGKRTPFLTHKSLAWVSCILTFVHVFGTSFVWKVGTACNVGSCLSSDICKCVEHLAINVNKFNGFVLLAAKHLMTDCFESQPWECISEKASSNSFCILGKEDIYCIFKTQCIIVPQNAFFHNFFFC
jgi:hypothetical protein